MRFTTVLVALAASAAAMPAPDSFAAMAKRFADSEECKLPDPGTNCAGAKRKDVVVQYGQAQTQESKALFLNAAKAAGASITFETSNYGFAGFVPDSVIDLIKAHGATCGLKVTDNGCSGIPWCGESPC